MILLPQYPDFDGDSHLYTLPKADIEAYLATLDPEPLIPQPIPFINSGIVSLIDGFQGFEAIAFAGDHVYLTVEAELTEGMRGYLVAGQMIPGLREVVLEVVISEILPQTKHGVKVNEAPIAHCFGSDLKAQEPLPFLNIEYRVTDATSVDSNGRFWVINFYDPRDKNLQTDSDALADCFGWGASHSTYNQVERLVELQITNDGIGLTDTPPVFLQLLRNVARKDYGLGF